LLTEFVKTARRRKRRDIIFAFVLLAPALLCVLGLIDYPMYLVFALSFHEGQSMNLLDLSRQPLGIGNYVDVLTDSQTWQSVLITLYYTSGSMIPAFLLGLCLALLLNERFALRRWLRGLSLLPWAIPSVLASIVFLWLFDASYGVVDYALRTAGLMNTDIAWFFDENTALFAVILPTFWKCFPFFTLTFVAAMQTIPSELYEAARSDGANSWQRFRYVTWPGIRGPAILALVLNSLWAFREFDIIYVTTGGGPSHATETLGIRAYQEAFSYFELGRASVLGVLMLAIALLFVVLARRALQKEFF